MSIQVSKILSQGDITYSLSPVKGKDSGSYVDLEVTLFSSLFPRTDFSIEYRIDEWGSWQTVNYLVASTSGVIDNNIVRAAKCSESGSSCQIRWNYLAEDITPGSKVNLRLSLLSFPLFFERCRNTTYIEGGTDISNPWLAGGLDFNIVGIDHSGNWICVATGEVFTVTSSGTRVLTISGLTNPVAVISKPDAGFLILDSGTGFIIETDSAGAAVQTWDGSTLLSSPKSFFYDPISENILVTGGDIHKAYEINWGTSPGTVLWQFGGLLAGSGSSELNSPHGICYGGNLSTVIVADKGNNRIVSVDRAGASDTVSLISEVTLSGESISLNSPVHVAFGTSLIICEETGTELTFSSTKSLHPTLSRYNSSLGESISGANGTTPYRNLLFTPLLETIKDS